MKKFRIKEFIIHLNFIRNCLQMSEPLVLEALLLNNLNLFYNIFWLNFKFYRILTLAQTTPFYNYFIFVRSLWESWKSFEIHSFKFVHFIHLNASLSLIIAHLFISVFHLPKCTGQSEPFMMITCSMEATLLFLLGVYIL